MRIVIETIPHRLQRYKTVGDWFWVEDTLVIHVSEMGDWKKEMAVALHEAVECLLCKAKGITQEMVDGFDVSFEKGREAGDESEPGDHPAAPYRDEHRFATIIERLLVAELGLDWKEYGSAVEALSKSGVNHVKSAAD